MAYLAALLLLFTLLHANGRTTSLRPFLLSIAPVRKGNPLVDTLSVSRTIEIHSLTKDMEKSGQKVYSMSIGEPNYEPPQEVIDSTIYAAKNGITKYTTVTGTLELREAISRDITSRKHQQCSPDQIVVSNGAKQAVLQALLAVVKPGDKVIIPAPYWTSYPDMVKLCYGEPVIAQTTAEDNYNLNPGLLFELFKKHQGKVSCLIICNPNNPSGAVPSKEHLQKIVSVLKQFPEVFVISDEIYERILYDGAVHTSIASLPDMQDRTITINGPSKAYSMTGFRVGYSISPPAVAKAIGNLQSQISSCASSLAQHATLATLTDISERNPQWLTARVSELQQKRDLCMQLIGNIPNVKCSTPLGAFYLFPDVSYYFGKKFRNKEGQLVVINNSHTLCIELLKAYQVALVPGEAFGVENNIRLCYAADDEVIEESLKRLREFLLALV